MLFLLIFKCCIFREKIFVNHKTTAPFRVFFTEKRQKNTAKRSSHRKNAAKKCFRTGGRGVFAFVFAPEKLRFAAKKEHTVRRAATKITVFRKANESGMANKGALAPSYARPLFGFLSRIHLVHCSHENNISFRWKITVLL